MSVWGIATVRNEADVIAGTITRMAAQVDHLLVADNLSTDGTDGILEAMGVQLVEDHDPAFHQVRKTARLVAMAADYGATWVVPFDADEVVCSRWGRLANVLENLSEDYVVAPWYQHVCTAVDPDVSDPISRMGYRRPHPHTLPKVICRTSIRPLIEQGAHAVSYPAAPAICCEVHHYPYRSAEQMTTKVQQGIEAADLAGQPPDALAHWRRYRGMGHQEIAAAFEAEHYCHDPSGLVFDPCPV